MENKNLERIFNEDEPLSTPSTTYSSGNLINTTEHSQVQQLCSQSHNSTLPASEPHFSIVDTHQKIDEKHTNDTIVSDGLFYDEKVWYDIDLTDTAKTDRCQKPTTPDNNEGGDRLTTNYEIKINSIEKTYDEIQIQSALLANQVQLNTDMNKLTIDHITMANTEIIKIKNEVEALRARVASRDAEDSKNIECLVNKIDRLTSDVSALNAVVQAASEENASNATALVDCVRELREIGEQRRSFEEYVGKSEEELDRLKASEEIKTREVNTLLELVGTQNNYIDSYKKTLRMYENYVQSNKKLKLSICWGKRGYPL